MKAAAAQMHLSTLWQEVNKQLDQLFYYSEEEDLRIKPNRKGAWSVLEVLFHINLVNAAYLKNMPPLLDFEKGAPDRELKRSFIGTQIEKYVALKPSGQMKLKIKSPSLVNPIIRQKAGHAAIDKIVFREIIQDLEQIKKYIDVLDKSSLELKKVSTLYPIFKVNGADTLFILLEHELRHLAQAKRIIAGEA